LASVDVLRVSKKEVEPIYNFYAEVMCSDGFVVSKRKMLQYKDDKMSVTFRKKDYFCSKALLVSVLLYKNENELLQIKDFTSPITWSPFDTLTVSWPIEKLSEVPGYNLTE
jgi:hypothetical protein